MVENYSTSMVPCVGEGVVVVTVADGRHGWCITTCTVGMMALVLASMVNTSQDSGEELQDIPLASSTR